MSNISKPSGSPEPDIVSVVYSLGIALRRVLILVDKRKAAARNARTALAQADALLRRTKPGRPK